MSSESQLRSIIEQSEGRRRDIYASRWEYDLEPGARGQYRILVEDHRFGPNIHVPTEDLAAYIVALHNETLAKIVSLNVFGVYTVNTSVGFDEES